jgi:two-component system OmpR family response regulator
MSSYPSDSDKVADDDVFSITAEGEKQLKDSATSLSSLEIRLLVLVNGASNVGQICSRATGAPSVASIAALRSLLAKKMISRADRSVPAMAEIGIGDFLKTVTYYVGPAGPTPESEGEANEGVGYLKNQGYYVRIARRALAARKPTHGGRFTAVIVEDEPHLAKLLRTFLAIEGFDARTAANRAEILEALRKPPLPDLILLDVILPDADGFEILAKLRQHPAFTSCAIVMLTSMATREAVLKGIAGGADGYVTKPFEMDVLMKAVHTVLGLPQH